jgi:disulfide oxidoreductase YuzD
MEREITPMTKKLEIKWLTEPEDHDYPAALSYLSLLFDKRARISLVNGLRRKSISKFKAKDIFRASGLSLLGVSNSHVEKDRQKIQSGQKLSPLLLVRDSANGKVIIADGYHRLCAVYSFDEDAEIPCKII